MVKLEQRRESVNDVFPKPKEGAVWEINPTGFVWLPEDLADNYELIIKDKNTGENVFKKELAKNYFVPKKPFDPGEYLWTFKAYDKDGNYLGEREAWSFTVPENTKVAVCPDAETILQKARKSGHPILVFSEENIGEVRKRIKEEQSEELEILKNTVEQAYEMGMPPAPTHHLEETEQEQRMYYFEYFAVLRKYIDTNMTACALYYLITEDKKAGEHVRQLMLHVCAWNPEGPNAVDGPWWDEPGLSYSRCLHKCYDWTYDLYEEREREFIENTLVLYCRQTYRRLKNNDFMSYPGVSHMGRLPGYLGEQAILLQHKLPEAEEMLQYVLDIYNTFYPHFGGEDGGWAEGVSYASGYNRRYISFFATIENITGFSFWDRPFYKKIKDFFIYCCPPNAENIPFGDGQENGPGVDPARSAQFGALFKFYANRFDDPLSAWRASQCKKVETFGGHILENFVYPASKKNLNDVQVSNDRVFRGIGWAALHSDITDLEQDNYLIFKSSPFGSVSHSHADQNSFCIASGGNMLAIASGYYGPRFGLPHHAQWTWQTKANNSILVNGKGQSARDHEATGYIVDFKENDKYSYVSGDATAAYKGELTKFIRHVLLVSPNLFLIYDDLETSDESVFSWLLHCYEEPVIEQSNKQLLITRNDRKMRCSLFSNDELSIEHTEEFETPFNYGMMKKFHQDRPNQHHITANTGKVRSAKILAVMKIWQDNEPALDITKNDDTVQINKDGFVITVEMGSGKAGIRAGLDVLI